MSGVEVYLEIQPTQTGHYLQPKECICAIKLKRMRNKKQQHLGLKAQLNLLIRPFLVLAVPLLTAMMMMTIIG